MDNFKSPNLNGKKVLSITFPGIEGCCPPTSIIVGELFDKMIYYCEYLGEYGIDWILCYKDGQLVAQHNAKFIQSVKFETEQVLIKNTKIKVLTYNIACGNIINERRKMWAIFNLPSKNELLIHILG